MLKVTVKPFEMFDESNSNFVKCSGGTLCLEHSLLSISKWESKFHKAFLDKSTEHSFEEDVYYIKCMTLNKSIDSNIYLGLDNETFFKINSYINDPMSATQIYSCNESRLYKRSSKVITSEIIYSWMIEFGIPFECQKWHLNRLLTLIDVCNIQSNPGKMTKRQTLDFYKNENKRRRQLIGSKG